MPLPPLDPGTPLTLAHPLPAAVADWFDRVWATGHPPPPPSLDRALDPTALETTPHLARTLDGRLVLSPTPFGPGGAIPAGATIVGLDLCCLCADDLDLCAHQLLAAVALGRPVVTADPATAALTGRLRRHLSRTPPPWRPLAPPSWGSAQRQWVLTTPAIQDDPASLLALIDRHGQLVEPLLLRIRPGRAEGPLRAALRERTLARLAPDTHSWTASLAVELLQTGTVDEGRHIVRTALDRGAHALLATLLWRDDGLLTAILAADPSLVAALLVALPRDERLQLLRTIPARVPSGPR